MGYKERLDNAFRKYGEDILLNGTIPMKGFFQILDQNRMNAYFDSVEQGYIDKPGLIVMVPGDSSAAVGNTVTRDGRTYTIKKVAKFRIVNSLVMQTLLLT